MAAGLLRLRSEGRVNVRSAGSLPADQINPAVIEAMEEVGVDMSEAFPKPLTDEVVRADHHADIRPAPKMLIEETADAFCDRTQQFVTHRLQLFL